MKRNFIIILSILLISIIGIFLYGVYERYMNAIGQHRSILLAETLKNYYRKNKSLPSTLIKEINNTGCLSDGRGNLICIDNISDDCFSIRYAPDKDNVLIIKWNRDMENIEIKSSIKNP